MAAPIDKVAKSMGFSKTGFSSNGHPRFEFCDSFGTTHIVVGGGKHNKRSAEIDAQRARQRMTKCVRGQCDHSRLSSK